MRVRKENKEGTNKNAFSNLLRSPMDVDER